MFVDAGYFWVQAGHVLHGSISNRDAVCIDFPALRQEVLEQATAQFPNAELLRVYWYDGPGPQGNKAPAHHSIDELDDFKLRLGTRNGHGAQKAVDGLIIADLIGLAQSKAISGAIVLSGDADLTPGVIAAQGLGIRVHLLSMGPANATSPYLRAEVDFKGHWADPVVLKFARPNVKAAATAIPAAALPAQIEASAAAAGIVAGSISTPSIPSFGDIARLALASAANTGLTTELVGGSIPKLIDGKLLWLARKQLGRDLMELEKRQLRTEFKRLLAQGK